MAKKKRTLKQFDAYVEGDGDLRKSIFAQPPASQQIVFELFAQLDHCHYGFLSHFSSVPSTALWNVLLGQIAAITSGSARNRNFCEDYETLAPVLEHPSEHGGMREKVVDLVGGSHALWWEMSDPGYETQPNGHAVLNAVLAVNPSRMAWEWWFEERANEAKALLQNKATIPEFEHWARSKLGLLDPTTSYYQIALTLVAFSDHATQVKHRIAKPYLRIAYTIAKSIAAHNQPQQFFDTFNIACSGLMRSIAKYAPSMAMAFANFADREIRYEIYYQLGNYNLVSLPHKTWQRHREFEQLKKQYSEKHGVDASLDEIAQEYRLDRAEVFDVYRQVSIQNPTSLDSKLFPEEKNNQQTMLKDRMEDPALIELRQTHDDHEMIFLALRRMSLRDRKIFIATHNVAELAQDMDPDPAELYRFFSRQSQPVEDFHDLVNALDF